MGKKQVEVDTYNCTYCGFEAIQLTKLAGQSGETRFICGDCMIKAFDKGIGYEPINEPAVPEPSKETPSLDPGVAKTEPAKA